MQPHSLWIVLPVLGFALEAAAQKGASSASLSRTRYLSSAGVMPAPGDITIEHFVNYHRHVLPAPRGGRALALDLRWGNPAMNAARGEAVLQIGWSTQFVGDRQRLRPLNLALVIDKSGSMNDEDKMAWVKDALTTLVDKLRPSDTLSIVTYDTTASVVLPATCADRKPWIKEVIRGITPGGWTNLHGGLMLGFRECQKHCRRHATNRVILLSDGIANRGVTDPERILRDALRFGDRGIDLSTIGVGLQFNRPLLERLAKGGRGLFHFVADARDIHKVFVDEVQSLMSPVARSPRLEVRLPDGLAVERVYGYDARRRRGGLVIELEDINHGTTQVALLKVRLAGEPVGRRLPVRVKLTYFDVDRSARAELEECAMLRLASRGGGLLEDPRVRKNFTIACMADAMRRMAVAWQKEDLERAQRIVDNAIGQVAKRYPHAEDADIRRTLDILLDYQRRITRFRRLRGC